MKCAFPLSNCNLKIVEIISHRQQQQQQNTTEKTGQTSDTLEREQLGSSSMISSVAKKGNRASEYVKRLQQLPDSSSKAVEETQRDRDRRTLCAFQMN